MKGLVFAAAALCVPPFAFLLAQNRRWMRYAFVGVVAAMCLYEATSINFLANPDYRGTSRGLEVSLAHLMAFSLLGAVAFSGRLRRLVPDRGAALFLLYALLCLPSLSAAENVLFGLFEVWKMALLYVLYLAVRSYLRATDDLRTVLRALAAFAAVNFAVVVRAHVAGVWQPHGLFPHQNSMAVAMNLLGCLFLAGYVEHGAGTRLGRLCLAGFLCAAAAAVRSYSRMALALMPVGYGLAWLLCVVRVRPRRWLARTAPLAVAGLVALAAMAPRIVQRFETAPKESGSTRVELALCAWEMVKDEPLRGVGLNNWGIKINPPYEYAERAGRNPNRDEEFRDGIVETVYLLVGAECGIPALAAMLVWFFYYLLIACRLVKKLKGTPYAAIPAGLAGGLVACYLQSCLEWVLRQQMNLILLMIFFAVLDHLNKNAARIAAEARGGGHA